MLMWSLTDTAIEKLGYGPTKLTQLGIERGKGYIYGAENCFGFVGEWSGPWLATNC